MAGRISAARLLVGSSLSGPIDITSARLLSATPLSGPVRVSTMWLLQAVRTDRTGFFPDTLESNSEIYGLTGWTVTLHSSPIPEHNPYRASVPDQLYDTVGPATYDYMRENQEILREQHDFIQAGDSTFPVELMYASHTDQHFTLGSLSRFFHKDYGIIHARYVQFGAMKGVTHACCPVGFYAKNATLQWVVTNDISLSSPDLVVGISSPWTTPAEGTYGWVIVDGAVLQPITNHSTDAAQGESFAWETTGAISNTAKGRVLGRRLNKGTQTQIFAGQFYVCLESYSETQLNDIISTQTQSLLESLTQLQTLVTGLPSATALLQLTKQITAVKASLTNEISNRQSADKAINELLANIDAVTQQDLDNAVKNAKNSFQAGLAALAATVESVRDIAIEALTKAQPFDPSSLQTQIGAILDALYVESQKPKNRFPVVDGSVPPILVYLDDGSLVYTETH